MIEIRILLTYLIVGKRWNTFLFCSLKNVNQTSFDIKITDSTVFQSVPSIWEKVLLYIVMIPKEDKSPLLQV